MGENKHWGIALFQQGPLIIKALLLVAVELPVEVVDAALNFAAAAWLPVAVNSSTLDEMVSS